MRQHAWAERGATLCSCGAISANVEHPSAPTTTAAALAAAAATAAARHGSEPIRHQIRVGLQASVQHNPGQLNPADGSKQLRIDCTSITELQVVKDGCKVHTIWAVLSKDVQQTIIGWKDLKALVILSPDLRSINLPTGDSVALCEDNENKQKLGELKQYFLSPFSSLFNDKINKEPMSDKPMKIHVRTDIYILLQNCYVARQTRIHQQ
jgi:hypothetical protein